MNSQQKLNIKTESKSQKYFSQPKDFIMLVLGIIASLYLLNFTFGVIEFLPDTFPIVGNLDEAVMLGLLASVFQYFGINVTNWFKRK